MNHRPIDLILSVMPELAPAYTPGDHRRAAAKLTRDLEWTQIDESLPADVMADDSPEQTACDEAEAEERMYQRSIASGRIKGAK